MGASFQTMKIKTTDRQLVKAKFEQAQDQDRYENGHSYSGGFGMARELRFVDKTFATDREADQWLADNCEKWEAALAVKVKDGWLIGAWCAE